MTGARLAPGDAHPNPPLAPDDLAERFHVDADEIRRWLDAGLPTNAAGRVDPFNCANWLSWGRLDRCPALARRWRGYLLRFASFVAGTAQPVRRRWRRTHRLHLPVDVDRVRWWLPASAVDEWQSVSVAQPLAVDGVMARAVDGGWRLDLVAPQRVPFARGEEVVERAIRRGLGPDDAEYRSLLALVEDVAAEFRYEYRHHAPGETAVGIAGVSGSCLDCVRALGARLAEADRPWRLVGGIVADSALANPHFWVETETTRGWQPLDPSLPAIARMLGADWRAFARAYTGGLDAARVAFATLDPRGLPAGPTVASLIGEAMVEIDGIERDAWACIDWVGGDCEAEFSVIESA